MAEDICGNVGADDRLNVLQRLRDGGTVVHWGISLAQARIGSSNYVLAYEKSTPKSGGWILHLDGAVQHFTPEALQHALQFQAQVDQEVFGRSPPVPVEFPPELTGNQGGGGPSSSAPSPSIEERKRAEKEAAEREKRAREEQAARAAEAADWEQGGSEPRSQNDRSGDAGTSDDDMQRPSNIPEGQPGAGGMERPGLGQPGASGMERRGFGQPGAGGMERPGLGQPGAGGMERPALGQPATPTRPSMPPWMPPAAMMDGFPGRRMTKTDVPFKDSPLVGGKGGVPFRVVSPKGQPVVGVRYRLGPWSGQEVVAKIEGVFQRTKEPGPWKYVLAREGYASAQSRLTAATSSLPCASRSCESTAIGWTPRIRT